MLDKRMNPFIISLVVPIIKVVTGTKKIDGQLKLDYYEFDSDGQTHIYTGKARRNHIFSMSSAARDLYFLILYTINTDYQHVVITMEKITELYTDFGKKPIGERTLRDAINELRRESIIEAKDSKAGKYWINPSYFFAGNRPATFPECKVLVKVIDKRDGFDQLSGPLS